MEALSLPHLLIIFLIVVIFFGGRRIPEVMRGMGEGIRSFREGMNGPAEKPTAAPPPANTPSAEPKR
jgi:sec-independent protein translocase protein TatA